MPALPHLAHRLAPPMTTLRPRRMRGQRRGSETHFDPHRAPLVERAG